MYASNTDIWGDVHFERCFVTGAMFRLGPVGIATHGKNWLEAA
jgi:hypothetical protein